MNTYLGAALRLMFCELSGDIIPTTTMSATKVEALDNIQYIIGWIYALEIELIAARQFLDKTHGRPHTKSRNDKNSYVLGEAEGYNVIVAVLPDGVYGTT